MARYAAAGRTTGAGSTTLPTFAVVASANIEVTVYEIGIFNTTTTAFSTALRKITTAGTPGSTITSLPYNIDAPAVSTTVKDTFTSTGPTITTGSLYTATIGAAAGAGVIWTFGGSGLIVPKGTANGLACLPLTGTGQIVDFYVVFEEG